MLTTTMSGEQLSTVRIVNVPALVCDLEAFLNGWTQHESALTPGQYSAEVKW